MYPENQNKHKGRNIVIGILVGLFFCGLTAGCIAVAAAFVRLAAEGKLDKYVAERDGGSDEGFGYYGDDGVFHYYGEEEEEGFGYYDEDGEFHYYGQDSNPRDIFQHSTHEDYEGYETGEYFSIPADNRVEGLSYTVDIEEKEYYDKNARNTYVYYSYAVVDGDVPNKDQINNAISEEWESFLSYYEEAYPSDKRHDDYVKAEFACNVAYMTEEIFSIVYQETIFYYDGSSDYPEQEYYLYSLNFDMENGQLLDKTGILDIDEAFIQDFKERSVKQNGDSVLDYYNDYELEEYFHDDNSLILFYCPQGMEIGINVEQGWVTVTYPDYEKYIKTV